MNRVSKAILAGVAGLIGAGVLLGIGVRWYFGSVGAHARIEAALTERIGAEVRFKQIHFSVVNGLSVVDLEVLRGPVRVLEVARMNADLRWWPLLRKRLWLEALELDSPKFQCAQSEKGDWIFPVFGKGAAGSKPVQDPNRDAKAGGTQDAAKPRGAGLGWKLGSVKVTNGSAEFRGRGGELKGTCSGIEYAGVNSPEGLGGRLQVAELEWFQWARLEKFESGFTVSRDRWNLEGIKAGLAGGSLGGSLSLTVSKRGTPFEGDFQLAGTDLSQLVSEAGVEGNRLSGRLGGKVRIRGECSKFKQFTGDGEFHLSDGTLRQMDLLRAIGQVLRVEELERLELSGARTRFALGKERIHFEEFELNSARVGITGNGTLQFDGKAGFDVLLGLQDSLHKKLPDFVRESFQEVAPGNRPGVRFKVTGKAGQLKTDLAEKLVGRKVPDQLESLVSGLLGLVRKPEKEDMQRTDGGKDGDGKKKKKKAPNSDSTSSGSRDGSKPADSKPAEDGNSKAPVQGEPVQGLDGKVGAENP